MKGTCGSKSIAIMRRSPCLNLLSGHLHTSPQRGTSSHRGPKQGTGSPCRRSGRVSLNLYYYSSYFFLAGSFSLGTPPIGVLANSSNAFESSSRCLAIRSKIALERGPPPRGPTPSPPRGPAPPLTGPEPPPPVCFTGPAFPVFIYGKSPLLEVESR